MTCKDCERMREALADLADAGNMLLAAEWFNGGRDDSATLNARNALSVTLRAVRDALAPATKPPAVHDSMNTPDDVDGPLMDTVSDIIVGAGLSDDLRVVNPISRKILRAVHAAVADVKNERDFYSDSLKASWKNGRIQWERAEKAEADLRIAYSNQEALIAERDHYEERAEKAERELEGARRRSAIDESQCDDMTGLAGKLALKLTEVERERDELNDQWTATGKVLLERAEKAEREKDEARIALCDARSAYADVCGRMVSPRQIAKELWPNDADRLFPAEVTK